ncbi:MAG: pyrH [Gammaproteobacteria bacterium]|jgi:uridylate kinase|nr:pyrH [Gammaproteobacteria bacterium]MCE3239024.1 pyrH [Gammaproteobacteria bacterium]
MTPIYKRILLKLSGEAFQENDSFGISPSHLIQISAEIARVSAMGVQVGLVVGAGNFVRGADFCKAEIDRVTADQMGMLATMLNGLALRDALDRQSIPVKVMSALAVPGIMDFYSRRSAIDALQKGYVVIFVGGTGNPLVTTDSAAALRGIEINADVLIKATKVDGVFSEDPFKNPQAEYYSKLTYKEVLERHLGVMDLNAIILCQAHTLPVQILNMHKPDALQQALVGKAVGTLVS